jgi:preprotein translocase SecF subunit
MQFFKSPNIAFIRVRRKAIAVSAVLILTGLVFTFVRGGYNSSIDFAGGTLVEVKLAKPVPLGEIRRIITDAGFSGAEVTNFGSPDEILIKVKGVGQASEAARKIEDALNDAIRDQKVEMRRTETVGPKIGSELKTAAFWAIIYSLAGIVVYISWRFEFRFAVGAILALIHDVLITLGFFSVTNREISLPVIAAILTIVGYSLNDTIVVFDRIRENLRMRKRENFDAVVNASINETLSRTIITSMTTLFVVMCLAVLGGEIIRDFALTLLVGVTVGTYSSIFVASPLLVEWQAFKSKKVKKKKK